MYNLCVYTYVFMKATRKVSGVSHLILPLHALNLYLDAQIGIQWSIETATEGVQVAPGR